jgi:hypothetical protein
MREEVPSFPTEFDLINGQMGGWIEGLFDIFVISSFFLIFMVEFERE